MVASPLVPKRPINLGFIVLRKDENGQPFKTTLPDGKEIESPLIMLNHWDLPSDVKINFSFWDVDNEQLPTLYSDFTTQEEAQKCFQKAHDMMQDFSATGGLQRLRDQRLAERNQRRLESQIRDLGAVPITAND